MANIKSQIKRNRQNEVRREKNKAVRSELKTRTKNALIAAETGAEDAAERLRDGREADRQGRRQGRHPRQPGVPAQVASRPSHRGPHERGRRGELSLSLAEGGSSPARMQRRISRWRAEA